MKLLKELFVAQLWALQRQSLISFKHEEQFMQAYLPILAERGPVVVNHCEALNITRLVQASAKVPGDLAEVGMYRGGSAKLICEYKGSRAFHGFDMFEDGLPEPTGSDTGGLKKGDFAASHDGVRSYLSGYRNVSIHKGMFPATAGPIRGKSFSFVNIDIDLYEGTRDCVEFFYPRMSKGGIMLFHDYSMLEGVRKAVDEFMRDKPEPVIRLYVSQGCVVKV